MNFIKTPHQKLLEEAGAAPATPGMIKTPQQALMEQSGMLPQFADGGSVNDMMAELFNAGQVPQHFRKGGQSIAELYAQIPQRQAEYKKEQEIKPNLSQAKQAPLDPYFQNIIDRASLHNYNQMLDEANPEQTFRAQPETATSWTRDQVAKLLGEKQSDRFFGTGSEGQKMEYMPLQFLNPLAQGAAMIDVVPESARQVHEGKYGEAALGLGLTGLGALPYIGPVIKKFKK